MFLVSIFVLTAMRVGADKTKLYLGGLVYGSLEYSVDLAIEDINNKTDILPDYELVLIKKNTRRDYGVAAQLVSEFFHHDPPVFALSGPEYTVTAETPLRAANLWNMATIAYSITGPVFNDRELYPYFVRTIQSDIQINYPRVELLKQFGWDRVAVVYQADSLRRTTVDHLLTLLIQEGITIEMTEGFEEDPHYTIQSIKDKDVRVIISVVWARTARHMMCQAYKAGIADSRHVWIFEGNKKPIKFWESATDGCTTDQMMHATELMFFIGRMYTTTMDVPSVTGINGTYFNKLTKERSGWSHIFTGHAYDSIVTVALGLNQTIPELLQMGLKISDFHLFRENFTKLFIKNINKLSFLGLTGDVAFSEGERLAKLDIYQTQNYEMTKVGIYDTKERHLTWDDNAPLIWKNGRAPPDEIITIEKPLFLSWMTFVLLTCLVVMGICLCIFFIVFNVIKRDHKIIKMSSPRLNFVMITGCILVYVSVVLFALDTKSVPERYMHILCQGQLWTLSLGFTLAYGTMFAKTYRVHRLLTKPKAEKRLILDRHLLLMVAILIIIEVAYLMIWAAVSPFKVVKISFAKQESAIDDQIIIPSLLVCTCDGIGYWLPGLYAYKGILLLFGIFLAWETRKVKVEALNDSKAIGICVYNVFLLSSVGLLLSMILDRKQFEIMGTVRAVCTILATTVTLGIVYLSKVIQVIRGVEVGKVSFIPTISTKDKTVKHCTGNCSEAKRLRALLDQKSQKVLELQRQFNVPPSLAQSVLLTVDDAHSSMELTSSTGISTHTAGDAPSSTGLTSSKGI